MPSVMITCPSTKKPVHTGVNAPKEAFKTQGYQNCMVTCPHCGMNHIWSKQDAYLEGDKPK